MKDYTELVQRKFPTDNRLGFFLKPNMPAAKLGKVLNAFTKLNMVDVVGFHLYGGMFSSGAIALTKDMVYYDKGFFKLEDIKGATTRKEYVDVSVNQGGNYVTHALKTENEQAAKLLADFLDDVAYEPKAEDLLQPAADYSAYSKEAVNWLELRDEVLKTIDLLHQRFDDGKLSLIEFEEKKADLLARL